MALSEFALISRYFAARGPKRPECRLGIGDDAALIRPPVSRDVAVTTDTLVSGVHFPPDTSARALGHKALAVNLSDLAAMGAEPAFATLALTLPEADEAWLDEFSQGFFSLADQAQVALIGGDTTRGPLAVTVQLLGWTRPGKAVLRRGARPGDLIYVTGTLGDAGLALEAWRRGAVLPAPYGAFLRGRLDCPSPRYREGRALGGVAHAMIDLSDGLAGDLGHLLKASAVGADIALGDLPLSEAFRIGAQALGLGDDARDRLVLSAGDDYELCFTVPSARRQATDRLFAELGCPATVIGVVNMAPGFHIRRADGVPLVPAAGGYDHFAGGRRP